MPEFKQTSTADILAKTLPDTTGLGVIYTSLPENTMILAHPRAQNHRGRALQLLFRGLQAYISGARQTGHLYVLLTDSRPRLDAPRFSE